MRGALLAAALPLFGCGAEARGSRERELMVRAYVFGAFGGRAIDVRDVCASGRARTVRLTRTASDYAAATLTLGMYVPHRVRVRCVGAQ